MIDEKTQEHQSKSLTAWSSLKMKLRAFLNIVDDAMIDMQKDADAAKELRARTAEEQREQQQGQGQLNEE
jgi:hypothetical protein